MLEPYLHLVQTAAGHILAPLSVRNTPRDPLTNEVGTSSAVPPDNPYVSIQLEHGVRKTLVVLHLEFKRIR